ncbi:MAG: glycosyltransferase family 9 protein [Chromatiales bacterium]|nr:glycosyltransferase family 9 protein [Chromatiales bacterium]
MPPFLSNPPDSLCLVRLSAIGDCCHTLPVVRTLQAAWPQTRITWIIGRTEHALLEGCAGIEFITYDKRSPGRGLRALRKELRGRHWPLLLHMQASMRANLVSLLVSADLRLGFDRPRARDGQWLFTNRRIAPQQQPHVMEGLFGFAQALGIQERVLRWDIPLSAADREFAASLRVSGRPLCVISPCSSQRLRNYRNWPVERQVALGQHLARAHRARIVLTGANTAEEQHFGSTIAEAVGEDAVDLVGRTSLKQLLALIAESDLVITPDSGPAHMATAAGTPVVGLYASSNPLRTGPWSCQDLVVDRYPEALAAAGLEPGTVRWGQRVRDPGVMALIELDDVTAKVDEVLGRSRRP